MKICLLGIEDSAYTKMMCIEFHKYNIEFDLILEKREAQSRLFKVLETPVKLYRLANTGRFKGLKKNRLFFMKEFAKRIFQIIWPKPLKAEYRSCSFLEASKMADAIYLTPHVNHVETLKIINLGKYDIGVLAGVGLVSGMVLESFGQFCLNAHPAPLPACKGGGALENTLNKNLRPAVTVHEAVEEIDAGRILDVVELGLKKNDDFDSVYNRLVVLCCTTMAENVRRLKDGRIPEFKNNSGGKLHYWAECDEITQKNARRNLMRILSDI